MEAECLECLIGVTRVEVPVAAVERLVEYQAAPAPPLAEPWLGGIGLDAADQDALFLSISLSGLSGGRAPGVRGLLFRAGEGGLRWALEVDRVVGLRAIEGGTKPHPVRGWACPSDWLLEAADEEGEPVRLLDVSAALRDLAGAPALEPRA